MSFLHSFMRLSSWGVWVVDSALLREGLHTVLLPIDIITLLTERIKELKSKTKYLSRAAAIMGSRFKTSLLWTLQWDLIVGIHALWQHA